MCRLCNQPIRTLLVTYWEHCHSAILTANHPRIIIQSEASSHNPQPNHSDSLPQILHQRGVCDLHNYILTHFPNTPNSVVHKHSIQTCAPSVGRSSKHCSLVTLHQYVLFPNRTPQFVPQKTPLPSSTPSKAVIAELHSQFRSQEKGEE